MGKGDINRKVPLLDSMKPVTVFPFPSFPSPPLPLPFTSLPSLSQVLSKSFSHSLYLHSPKQTEYLGRNGVGIENLQRKNIR